jgi:hypothetical protein
LLPRELLVRELAQILIDFGNLGVCLTQHVLLHILSELLSNSLVSGCILLCYVLMQALIVKGTRRIGDVLVLLFLFFKSGMVSRAVQNVLYFQL